jgi:hypothetical protein
LHASSACGTCEHHPIRTMQARGVCWRIGTGYRRLIL